MRHFMVVSEEYETGGYILGLDPPEKGCDVWEGAAKNRNHARLLAMKEWLSQRNSSALDNRSDDRHPMSGCRLFEYLPCELHEIVKCDNCTYVEVDNTLQAPAGIQGGHVDE